MLDITFTPNLPPVAPSASTAPSFTGTIAEGETITINEGTYSGDTPITITGVLELDGVDVSGDMVGSTYTIPASTGGETLEWSETASNGVTPDATQSVSATVSSASSTSATIVQFPNTDVVVGEASNFWVENVLGFADPDSELDFEWSFDDAGATPDVAQDLRSTDLNKSRGRTVPKAWKTAGTKNCTLTIRDKAGNVHVENFTATVGTRDSVTWTNTFYCDFGEVSGTPDFTGVPAEAGTIEHISTWDDLRARVNAVRAFGQKLLIVFKKGETFTRTGVDTFDADKCTVSGRTFVTYDASWGTVDPPVLKVNSGQFAYTWFLVKSGDHTARFTIYGVNAVGSYDPITTGAPTGAIRLIDVDSAASATLPTHCHIGIFQHEGSGCDATVRGVGSIIRTASIAAMDNHVTDWHDWFLGLFGERWNVAMCHNSVLQNPLTALRHDGKTTAYPNAADHGVLRAHQSKRVGVYNNRMANAGGWIGQAGTNTIQDLLRLYQDTNDTYTESVIDIIGNHGHGTNIVHFGVNGNVEGVDMQGLDAVVDGNILEKGRQKYFGMVRVNGITGIKTRNNVLIDHNQGMPSNMLTGILYITPLFNGSPTNSGPADLLTRPMLIDNNTIISLRDTTLNNDDDYAPDYGGGLGAWTNVTDNSGWNHTTPVETNNITHVPNHSNGGSFTDYTPFDPSDNFKPVATSAADDAVTSGFPVRDVEGNLRSNPTNIGAHHTTAVSASSVPAPVNTVLPTIAENPQLPGWYHVTDFGTWTNLSQYDLYLAHWEWLLDGVSFDVDGTTGSHDTMTDANGVTGDLTCVMTMTNASGVRVSVTSNTITIT